MSQRNEMRIVDLESRDYLISAKADRIFVITTVACTRKSSTIFLHVSHTRRSPVVNQSVQCSMRAQAPPTLTADIQYTFA